MHRKNFLPTYGAVRRGAVRGDAATTCARSTRPGAAPRCSCARTRGTRSPGIIAALDGAQVIFVCSARRRAASQPGDDGDQGPATRARWERLIARHRRGARRLRDARQPRRERGRQDASRARRSSWVHVATSGPARRCGTRRCSLADDRPRATSRALAPTRRCSRRPQGRRLPALERELTRRAQGGAGARDAQRGSTARRATAPAAAPRAAARPRPRMRRCPVVVGPGITDAARHHRSQIDARLVERWLVGFLRDEMSRRGFTEAVVGLSGGVDSAVTATLATRALGAGARDGRLACRTGRRARIRSRTRDARGGGPRHRRRARSTSARQWTDTSATNPTPTPRAAAT